jgi:hypothetical protein
MCKDSHLISCLTTTAAAAAAAAAITTTTINQSINQSIDQSINQLTLHKFSNMRGNIYTYV